MWGFLNFNKYTKLRNVIRYIVKGGWKLCHGLIEADVLEHLKVNIKQLHQTHKDVLKQILQSIRELAYAWH